MKISGAVFRNKNIYENTVDVFSGKYKNKYIYITTNHGHGNPKYEHLKRYDITVTDCDSGMYDVNTYEDFHTMRDAIRYALIGAKLIE